MTLHCLTYTKELHQFGVIKQSSCSTLGENRVKGREQGEKGIEEGGGRKGRIHTVAGNRIPETGKCLDNFTTHLALTSARCMQ